jgi:hypothetical protein
MVRGYVLNVICTLCIELGQRYVILGFESLKRYTAFFIYVTFCVTKILLYCIKLNSIKATKTIVS